MRIEKFRVWNTSKPRNTAREMAPEKMREFLEGFHSISFSSPKDDGLVRDNRGVRKDVRSGRRKSDKAFSEWHRKLHQKAYYTDIDGLEYSFENGEVKLQVLYDVKEWHVTERKHLEENANFKAMKRLGEIADIPFFIIWVKLEEM